MLVNTPDQNKSPLKRVINLSVIGVFGKVSLLTFLIAAGSALLGWLLDGILGTRPWLMIVLFIVSFPFAMLTIYLAVKSSFPVIPKNAQYADSNPEESHRDRSAS